MNKRDKAIEPIVITGMGIVSPLGETLDKYRLSLAAGRSGITKWKQPYAGSYSQIGGDMSDFDFKKHLLHSGTEYPNHLTKRAQKLLRTTPLSGRLTAAAALQAYIHAGLATPCDEVNGKRDNEAYARNGNIPETHSPSPARCGHVLAGHNLNAPYIYENTVKFREEPEYINPLYGIMYLDTDVLAVISELLNLRGPNYTIGGACASGNLALLNALDTLRAGRADVVMVSGAASPLGPVTQQGWAMIQALSIKSFNDTPQEASRPFDARREGFVPSEGAAAVVLETLESAKARGATIYASLLGAASTCNASRLTHPDQEAQVRVLQGALTDAGVEPEQIDYINAHATSTPAGDAAEVAAIKTALGDHAYRIPINATKSLVGHCLTSAAIVELVATVIQMQHEFVHPTINLTDPDPELDLDFVPHQARAHKIDIAVSNAFGFGGLNACVVVGRAPSSA